MKRLYATLKLFLGCSIGIFLGRCIYLYFDFKARPDLYAMQSAPWYVDLEIQGIITAVLAAKPGEYLYYVAKPDGHHIFTRTLDEHEVAVASVKG